MNLTRRTVLGTTAAALAAGPAHAEPGDKIRPLVLISKPQAVDPAQFQAAQLAMQQWRKLGLKITLQVVPATQQSSAVWMNRTKWDMSDLGDGWPPGAQRPGRTDLQPVSFQPGGNRLRLRRLCQSGIRPARRGAAAGDGPRQARGAGEAGADADPARPALRVIWSIRGGRWRSTAAMWDPRPSSRKPVSASATSGRS